MDRIVKHVLCALNTIIWQSVETTIGTIQTCTNLTYVLPRRQLAQMTTIAARLIVRVDVFQGLPRTILSVLPTTIVYLAHVN